METGLFKKLIKKSKKMMAAIHNKRMNSIIKQKKYVHLMFNDKFCDPFVKFINNNFTSDEHIFLVYKMFDQYPFPEGNNVIRISTLRGFDFSDDKIKEIIVHSLFWKECIDYFYDHLSLLTKKGFWMIWGGDLYQAERNIKEDAVRRAFKGYISDTDGDCDVVREKYELKNKAYFDAAYTFPITIEMVDDAIKTRSQHDYIQIQINNSSEETTLPMLDILSKFSDRDIRITTILSYGDDIVKDKIEKKGKELFGERFICLKDYLAPSEYAKWLSQNDIYILNQNRQQGLGNSFVSLATGAKLYINSFVTTYHHFNDKGIKVYDTQAIRDLSFEDFCCYDEKDDNMKNVRFFFDDEYLKKCWEPVFLYEQV